jgi:hypothetical protein
MIGYSENTKAPQCKDDVPRVARLLSREGNAPATVCATEIPNFLCRRKIRFAWKLGPDWRSSRIGIKQPFVTRRQLRNLDDPDSQMKKVAEAAHPDFAVLVPSCREISISSAPHTFQAELSQLSNLIS